MKLIQMIAQARHTAKKMADHSSQVAANNSFLSWFGVGSAELNGSFAGAEPEESGECLKKTHEFLERALENLCQIFKVRLVRSLSKILRALLANVTVASAAEPESGDTDDVQPGFCSG